MIQVTRIPLEGGDPTIITIDEAISELEEIAPETGLPYFSPPGSALPLLRSGQVARGMRAVYYIEGAANA